MILLYLLIGLIILVLVIIALRTLTFKTKTNSTKLKDSTVLIDSERAAFVLSQSIQVKTVSTMDLTQTDWGEFRKYQEKMKELFPLVHEKLELEIVNDYSLLYKWKGNRAKANKQMKKPILMLAHLDVVPIEEGSEGSWTYPPFSGAIEDGFVWGRGALDTKITMVSCLQGAETLLAKDFIPDRDIYFAFGHDEELRTDQGASMISKLLEERKIEFDFVLDEGGTIVTNAIAGIKKPIGLIGVAEKGFSNIKITARDKGGHSSMPPKHTALGIISKVVTNLEKKQCKLSLSKPVEEFLLTIGPEMKGVNKMIIANLWLFKPVFLQVFSKTKSGNALLRTTTAATMAKASMAPNILPESASGIFNFRIAPGDSGEKLTDHIKKVSQGLDIEIEPLIMNDPSLVSSSKTDGFALIKNVCAHLYNDAIIAPYIVLAGTDARKYENVCKNIYRFAPYKVDNSDLKKIHGTNECISVENIKNCVEFYVKMFENC